MNKQIRRLGVFMGVLYVALFAMLNYIQVFAAEDLNSHPTNIRPVLRDFTQPRGTIATSDGVVIARSVEVDDRFERQREYPEGQLYAHTTGFFNFSFGADGLERSYNDELAGQTTEQELRSFTDIFSDADQVGNLTLTLRDDVQRAAQTALGDRNGSVVAIDPRTGAILANWSFPSYDPNRLSSHDLEAAVADRQALQPDDPDSPLVPSTYRSRYFPGSTFKVVTGSTGVNNGRVTPENPVYPETNEYLAPGTTRPLRNFGGGTCGGALFRILAESCNTAFAEMGTQTIGPQLMVSGAEAFGFNERPPIDLPAPAASNFPTDFTNNLPALAQSSIGQNDVQATPLQMALVAAGVANNGVIMTPHVLAEIRDGEGDVVETYDEEAWHQAISPDAAVTMRQAMLGVVADGSAPRGMQIPGMEVGGKTGTAQLGTDPPSSHAWIIGFAGPPGGESEVAVAVLVEAIPGVSEITGGQTAAPIAKAVMEAALRPPAAPAADAGATEPAG